MSKKIYFILIVTLLFGFVPRAFAAFTYYRTVTVNGGQVPSTQTDFPMLVSGTFVYLKTVGAGGKVQDNNGYDIGFYSSSDCSTGKLNWETEQYTLGKVVYWVKVPSISNGTVIYMCYGNSSISTDQSNPTGVWDTDYMGVYHLPNGASLTSNDSTSNGKNLTNNGSWGAAAGQIDGGTAASNGSNQYLSNASLVSPNSITISFWQKYLAADVGNNSTPEAFNWGFAGLASPRILTHAPYVDSNIYWDYGDATNNEGRVFTSYLTYLDAWVYVTEVYDNGTGLHAIYLNGFSVVSNTHSTTNPNLTGFYVNIEAGGIAYDKRQLDELRVSQVARPADWITAEYFNQSAPSSFFTIGNETNVASPLRRITYFKGFKFLFRPNHKFIFR